MKQARTDLWLLKGNKVLALLAACCLMAGAPAHANLLTNGGFEAPIVGGGYVHRNGSELTGWTLYSSYRGTVQFDTAFDQGRGGNASRTNRGWSGHFRPLDA